MKELKNLKGEYMNIFYKQQSVIELRKEKGI